MEGKGSKEERRQSSRYMVGDNAYGLLKFGDRELIGAIVDLSLGGVALRYMAGDFPLTGKAELDILIPGDKNIEGPFCLRGLPYRRVCDFKDQEPSFSQIRARRLGLRFTGLSGGHLMRLEQLIQHYALRRRDS